MKVLAIFILTFIGIYLITSYTQWNLDPSQWTEGARSAQITVSIVIGTIFNVVAFMVTPDEISDKECG